MPEFSGPNVINPFVFGIGPPWRVSRWPNPNTIRVDGRRFWPMPSSVDFMPSRYFVKLLWRPPGDPNFHWEWFYFDTLVIGDHELLGDSGISASGKACLLNFKWFSELPFDGTPGMQVVTTALMPGEVPLVRTASYPNVGNPFQYDFQWSEFTNTSFIDPVPGIEVSTIWGSVDVQWVPQSECFDVAWYQPT